MLSNLAFVKFTWHPPSLIIKQLAPENGPGEPFLLCPDEYSHIGDYCELSNLIE